MVRDNCPSGSLTLYLFVSVGFNPNALSDLNRLARQNEPKLREWFSDVNLLNDFDPALNPRDPNL
jgi:hypothetical protein